MQKQLLQSDLLERLQMTTYKPPFWMFNGHFETIYSAKFRRIAFEPQKTFEINTPDEDFLTIYQWNKMPGKATVILSHGLEGNGLKDYNKGFAKALVAANYAVFSWNMRGCGKKMNKKKIFYHSGATYDLETVVDHIKGILPNQPLFLGAISLGANLTLKYLGEAKRSAVDAACVFSVPLDLAAGAKELNEPKNALYSWNFLKDLKKKIKRKAKIMPNEFNLQHLDKINNIIDFDDRYTAPIHGFNSALEYYKKCSSKFFIEGIEIPTAIINAKNDPFLPESCYLNDQQAKQENILSLTPLKGGHVGFYQKGIYYWSDQLMCKFFNKFV